MRGSVCRQERAPADTDPCADQLPFTSNTDEGKENLHPDARRGAGADFDGDTNPETGEVGGPKKDPLSWRAEWAFGGRTTDF